MLLQICIKIHFAKSVQNRYIYVNPDGALRRNSRVSLPINWAHWTVIVLFLFNYNLKWSLIYRIFPQLALKWYEWLGRSSITKMKVGIKTSYWVLIFRTNIKKAAYIFKIYYISAILRIHLSGNKYCSFIVCSESWNPMRCISFVFQFCYSFCNTYCVKSVQMRSFFWSVFSYIWTEHRKVRTRRNSVFGHFSRTVLAGGGPSTLFFSIFAFSFFILRK